MIDAFKKISAPKINPLSSNTVTITAKLTPSITPRPKDNKVVCRHSDFSFNVGNQWEYEVKRDRDKRITLITNLTEISTGSATFTHVLNNKEVRKTTMTCTSSGIYGILIPIEMLITTNKKDSSADSFLSESWARVKFLPPNHNVKLWKTHLSFNTPLNFLSNGPSEIVINHQSDDVGLSRNVTISIDESTLPIKLSQLGIKSNILIRYALKKNAGITKMILFVPGASSKESQIAVEMRKFKEYSAEPTAFPSDHL